MVVIFLRASTDFETMVRSSEESLLKLNFQFAKNSSLTVTEFEVAAPVYFRVVVEPNKMPTVKRLLLPSIEAPKGTTIDIRFDIDSEPEDLEIGMKHARRFIQALVNTLPSKPWTGLKGREEKRWKGLFLED